MKEVALEDDRVWKKPAQAIVMSETEAPRELVCPTVDRHYSPLELEGKKGITRLCFPVEYSAERLETSEMHFQTIILHMSITRNHLQNFKTNVQNL